MNLSAVEDGLWPRPQIGECHMASSKKPREPPESKEPSNFNFNEVPRWRIWLETLLLAVIATGIYETFKYGIAHYDVFKSLSLLF